MTSPVQIEQIRARVDAASDGPWWSMCMGSEGWNIRNDEIGGTVRERKPLVARVGYGEWEQDKANVAFIVNARSDIPDLLAAYDVMKQQRDEARTESAANRTAYRAACWRDQEGRCELDAAQVIIARVEALADRMASDTLRTNSSPQYWGARVREALRSGSEGS
jgi:hypothetical protein